MSDINADGATDVLNYSTASDKMNERGVRALFGKTLYAKTADIFKSKGEEHFRKIEEKVTLFYLERNKAVISIGGGAFANDRIRRKIKRNSISIWLNWKIKTILTRIKKNNRRPLALKMTNKNLTDLYKKRVNFYKSSDFKVKCDNKSKNEIINKIIKIVNNENPSS